MKPENSGTPPMRKIAASGYIHEPAAVLKTSMTVPTMWNITMTLASSRVSRRKASMAI
jgi:hypothetical protein